jgi:hypothetical protein
LEISNINSRKLQLFVLHEKPEAFCGKDDQDDLNGAACNGIENSLSLQLVASVNSNFLNLTRQQSVFTGNSTELFVCSDFRTSKVCCFGKGRV